MKHFLRKYPKITRCSENSGNESRKMTEYKKVFVAHFVIILPNQQKYILNTFVSRNSLHFGKRSYKRVSDASQITLKAFKASLIDTINACHCL